MTINKDKLAFLLKVNAHRQLKSIKDEDAAKKKAAEEDEKKPPKSKKP